VLPRPEAADPPAPGRTAPRTFLGETHAYLLLFSADHRGATLGVAVGALALVALCSGCVVYAGGGGYGPHGHGGGYYYR